ncbi:MAG: hypothetical protein KJ559_00120 [Nanoarchaeota archaeon]|nr:hypothetical protein [Nanoarchaeota archaeon]
MTLTEQIKEMQKKGIDERGINQNLKEQGYTPLEINQAMEQAQIKAAISENATDKENQEIAQQSIQDANQLQKQDYYAPSQEGLPESQKNEIMEYPQEQSQEMQEPQENYMYPTPQPQYQEYSEYQPYQSISPETITEITEQIIEEKTNSLKQAISETIKFKESMKTKIEKIDERLKKIESIIDKLQEMIISKVGEYGEVMGEIKDEMSMMQDSFSKALNPLIDKSRERKEQEEKPHKRGHGKKSSAIEHYLRR